MTTKKTKILFFILLLLMIFQGIKYTPVYAQSTPKGKTIIITTNRMNINDYENMNSIGGSPGYIGLMNIRGGRGTNDASSYASMGWGRKSYVLNRDLDYFDIEDSEKSAKFKFLTDSNPLSINNLNINTLILTNSGSDFGSLPGILGDEMAEKNLSISILGNSDKEENISFAGILAMDSFGRIPYGNISQMNTHDPQKPFYIGTDYETLLDLSKEHIEKSDLIIIELGDSYRLDEYRNKLNETSYSKAKKNMVNEIDIFIGEIKKTLGADDQLIVLSPFPDLQGYSEGYRLAPIYYFDKNSSGLITSSSTRREGVITNIDVAGLIFQNFELEKSKISGQPLRFVEMNNPWEFLKGDYQNIVSLSQVRVPVLYSYAVFQMCIWIIAMIVSFFYNKISEKVIKFVKFILRITLLIPIVIILAPLFSFGSIIYSIGFGLVLGSIIYIIVIKKVNNDLNSILILSAIMSLILLIDMSIMGQSLIKNSLLGYDPIIGARFYGIGNEYMGVLVGAIILTFSMIFEKIKFKNYIMIPIAIIVVFIMGNPSMGANVGGTITISSSLMFFILKSNNIKLDFKKGMGIIGVVIVIVATMAFIDFSNEQQSHLAGAISNINSSGPAAIIQIITRKLSMNMKLISVSIWSRVLILALILMSMLFYKPFGVLKELCQKYKSIANGWMAILFGSIVGFLVNDSGVVTAATSIGYVIVPMLIILLENNHEKRNI